MFALKKATQQVNYFICNEPKRWLLLNSGVLMLVPVRVKDFTCMRGRLLTSIAIFSNEDGSFKTRVGRNSIVQST